MEGACSKYGGREVSTGFWRVNWWRPHGGHRCRRNDNSWIFRKLDVGHRLDRTGLGLGQVADSYECTDVKCSFY